MKTRIAEGIKHYRVMFNSKINQKQGVAELTRAVPATATNAPISFGGQSHLRIPEPRPGAESPPH